MVQALVASERCAPGLASGLVSAQPRNPRGSHPWSPESPPDHRDWRVCRFDGFGDWGPAADGLHAGLVR